MRSAHEVTDARRCGLYRSAAFGSAARHALTAIAAQQMYEVLQVGGLTVLLLAQGLLWPKLRLSVTASWGAFWCGIYGALAILAAYTIAAVLGVGNETITLMGELPHGLADGTPFQETFIRVLAYSSAPTGLTEFSLILWGLRFTSVLAQKQKCRLSTAVSAIGLWQTCG